MYIVDTEILACNRRLRVRLSLVKKNEPDEAVRRLTVDKDAFDRALKALIASPALSKAELSAKVRGWHPDFQAVLKRRGRPFIEGS